MSVGRRKLYDQILLHIRTTQANKIRGFVLRLVLQATTEKDLLVYNKVTTLSLWFTTVRPTREPSVGRVIHEMAYLRCLGTTPAKVPLCSRRRRMAFTGMRPVRCPGFWSTDNL